MPAVLLQVRLKNFKSFVDQTIELGPTTLLVGANASGKSNLLDAILFLQGLAQGLPVGEILRGRWEGGRLTWPGVRGGAAEIARHSSTSFEIHSMWQLGAKVVQHEVEVSLTDEALIEREKLADLSDAYFDTHRPSLGSAVGRQPSGSLRVALRTSGTGRWPSAEYAASRSLLTQIVAQAGAAPAVTETIEALRDAIQQSTFLDLRPAQMRQHAPRKISTLGANGENVSALLWQLAQDPARKQDVIDWLSELCAPEIADIQFDSSTLLEEVMMILVERDGTKVSARSLSDGTLRFIGQLVALLTHAKGQILLVEEIENGLHPARVHLLIELIERITRAEDRQVIASTHSPLALRALSKSGLANAVVFGRTPDVQGSVMRRLGDLPHFEEVAERRGVDHLFTTRWLERAL